MENVVLVVHLILALLLIGAVLLQRSEGGALGMGGGGALMSGRSAATALQKATWALAAAFICTSLVLTVFATTHARDEGLLDRAPTLAPLPDDGAAPAGETPGSGTGLAPVLPSLPALPSLGEGDGAQ